MPFEHSRVRGHQEGRTLSELQRMTVCVAVPEAALDRLVGRYVDRDSGVGISVRREGGRLLARIDGQVELLVVPESETRFVYRAVEAALRFELEGDGAARSVVVEQDEGEWVLTANR